MRERNVSDFERRASAGREDGVRGIDLQALVVNVTLRCNQACRHCHVSSSPSRSETMTPEVMAKVAEIASAVRPVVIDITGGAPELNPHLPEFLRALHADGQVVQLRTNLTVLAEPATRHLAELYAELGVELLASMPDFTDRNVAIVRGPGVRDVSVAMLQRLNSLGYGVEGGTRLDLIYNPVGTTLPEPQAQLEALFRDEMAERFDVTFSHLLTMTNMPVGRFKEQLVAEGGYDRYVRALSAAYNPDAVPLLQCRHQIEIGWDGALYDCDFNLGAGLPVAAGVPKNVSEFDADVIARRRIAFGRHCLGCTAGAGSS